MLHKELETKKKEVIKFKITSQCEKDIKLN